jgi:arylsulfatase B
MAVAACAYWAVSLATAHSDELPARPNILLILVDDLGYGELGCQGNLEIPAPHIDALATGGIRFTQGYVTCSYCSPSRAGLMTGRYQTRFGYEHNPVGRGNLDPQAGLPTTERTLATHLKRAGYRTGLIGKWHLGGTEPFHPLKHGFDEFYGFLHEGHFFVPPPYEGVLSFLRVRELSAEFGGRRRDGDVIWSTHTPMNEPPYDENNPLLRGTEPIVEPKYLTDALTREATTFLEKNRNEPFFLYLSYNAVHSPMQAAHTYLQKFAHIKDLHRRVFAGMLANLDDSVGTVMARLRELDLEEKTLIFFISDNGGPTRELTSSNRPLRGGKGDLYEGGVRVPFVMQWKGRLPAGKTFDHPVITTDVFATVAALSGVAPDAERPLDGVNLWPFLTNEQSGPPHDSLFWRMSPRAALRHGDWKLVRGVDGWELYDLSRDIAESRDLATAQPDLLADLFGRWESLNAQMIEPVYLPPGRRR